MPDLILISLCIVSTAIALGATLAMLKQKNNTRRMDELELSMEAIARDVAVAYESLVGEIAQMRQETSQAVQAEQEKIASLVNGLGGATNQVLRELAGSQEAQATAAEEARASAKTRQDEMGVLLTGLDAKLAELTARLSQPPARAAKKAAPAPAVVETPAPAPVEAEPAPDEEEPEAPQPEPVREPARPAAAREAAREETREPAGKRLPARKAMGKKSVRKPPR